MSKIVNRYTLVELSFEIRKITNDEQKEFLLKEIEKYNSNSKSPYFIGFVEINKEEGLIRLNKYKKITEPTTLENLDYSTAFFNNETELKLAYNLNPKNERPLYIAYRSNKEIKTFDIIYRRNRKYIDKEYVKKRYTELSQKIEFINLILNNEQIKSRVRNSLDDFGNLYLLREMLKYKEKVFSPYMQNFYVNFIYEKGKFSYSNFRISSNILRRYEKDLTREENKKRNENLREIYEDIKLRLKYYGLEEAQEKILLKVHKTTKK